MNIILQSCIQTLSKSISLLKLLNNENLSNCSIPPYYSCVGSHIRHILDLYDCILEGYANKSIDLTNRRRDEKMHNDCIYAIDYVNRVINSIKSLDSEDMDNVCVVTDDLGKGLVSIKYTLGALLAQANSHAIHHYAIINYILDRLGFKFNDEDFGYNPTTPKSNIID